MICTYFMRATRALCYGKVEQHLRMALFSRCNLNSLSLLNHCYCKFSTGIGKFKSKNRGSVMTNLLQNKVNRPNNENIAELNNISPFDKEIIKRRNQACRSILVQVNSANSYDDLHNYCSQFGQILSMHHYHIHKQNDYILIEFQNTTAINDIMLNASFISEDVIVSAKSPVLWFRKGHPISFHNRRNNQKKISPFTENGWVFPVEKDIAKLLYNAKSISGQIICLYEALKLDDLETRLRFHTAHYLEQYFSGLFQNIRVLPFGSSVNGFGRKWCDVDLVIAPDNTKKLNNVNKLVFHTKPIKRDERYEIKEFLGTLANTMQSFMPGVYNVRRILEARVPIIKFNYEYVHLECDLGTTNLTAVYMTELLFLYGEIDWRVRPLVMAIREWAKYQKITSDFPGSWITNFSLTLLVLFYLQQKKILPSLNALRKYATISDIRSTDNGIDCTFLRDIKKLPAKYIYKMNQDNLEKLFHGFFEYYSTFAFHTKGICIREGLPIQKPTPVALYITNPLEITLNVSRNVNVYELNRIMQKTYDALYILETVNRSINNDWGLMMLFDTKTNVNTTKPSSKIKENIQDLLEDHSHVADKYEVNEIDIAESKIRKKETKEIV